eukprot:1578018-Rhodomonas_salina.5
MNDTDLAYGATSEGCQKRDAEGKAVLSRYGVPRTDIAYGAVGLRARYGPSGTDAAYGLSRTDVACAAIRGSTLSATTRTERSSRSSTWASSCPSAPSLGLPRYHLCYHLHYPPTISLRLLPTRGVQD